MDGNGGSGVGVETRDAARIKQRDAVAAKERHGDAVSRVTTIVEQIAEKGLKWCTEKVMTETTEARKFLIERKKEIAEEMERLSGAFDEVVKEGEDDGRVDSQWEELRSELDLDGEVNWVDEFRNKHGELTRIKYDVNEMLLQWNSDSFEEISSRMRVVIDSEKKLKVDLSKAESLMEELTKNKTKQESVKENLNKENSQLKEEVEKMRMRLKEMEDASLERNRKGRRRTVVNSDSDRGAESDEECDVRSERSEGRRGGDRIQHRYPPLSKYSGKKEDWDEFVDGFKMRFKDHHGAMILLKEHLSGEAKEAFRALPKAKRDMGLESSLKWLKSRLSEETPFEMLELEKKLRNQKIGERKVVTVCEELERWTERLHSRDEEGKESHRKNHFMLLYEGNSNEYSKLLEMFYEDKDYEAMKNAMIRMEYMRNAAKSMTGVTEQRRSVRCHNCKGLNHYAFQCTSAPRVTYGNDQRGSQRNPEGMNSGGGTRGGNWTSDGKGGARSGLRSDAQSFNPKEGNNQSYSGNGLSQSNMNSFGKPLVPQGGKTYGAASAVTMEGDEKQIANETEMAASTVMVGRVEERTILNESELLDKWFRKRIQKVRGKINGISVEVVLDTGAEVSIISRALVDQMEGAIVEVIRDGVIVTDAEGKRMSIVGRTVLDLDLEVGRKASTGFFVSDKEIPSILIGTRGLEAIGMRLMVVDVEEGDKESEERECTEEAVVLKDSLIAAGEVGYVVVNGISDRTSMLMSDKLEVIEGLSVNQNEVCVPIVNSTDTDIEIKKHEVIGKWIGIESPEKLNRKLVGNVASMGMRMSEEWREIKTVLEENRGGDISGELETILERNSQVFAWNDDELGRITEWECKIEVNEGQTPVRQKPRPVPFAIKSQLRVLLEKMKKQGVITESSSPWSSPVVIVRKKDGTIRLCIDFRKVNEVIKADAHPIPHVESTLQSLVGKKVFSCMDLSSGFWQLPLSRESREITGFSIMGEHFEFGVLPFGLNVSPSQFQRAMQEVLSDELKREGRDRRVHVYIDDVLLATETVEEHLELLTIVIERMRRRGIMLNYKKCKFIVNKVVYLGHVISENGVEMEDKKVDTVKRFERPRGVPELRSFLGTASYYRRFVKNFASIVHPLHSLTSTKKKWSWGEEQEKAFEEIKRALAECAVLAQPNFEGAIDGSKPFVLTTDASGVGIGGVISQEDENGLERPIAFHSRSLTSSEANYSIIDLEALAIFDCVRKWKHLFLGTRVRVRTDHEPLVSMFKRKNVSPRILRWATELMPYNLEIVHLKGKENIVADHLSRYPNEKEQGMEEITIGEDFIVNGVGTRSKSRKQKEEELEREGRIVWEKNKDEDRLNWDKWRDAQKKDEWITKIKDQLEMVKRGERDGSEMVKIPDSLKKVSLADLIVVSDVLFALGADHMRRLYVPLEMRDDMIRSVHESNLMGHISSKKLIQLMEKECYWGSMKNDITRVIRGCEKCRLANAQKKYVPELKPRVSNAPLECVAMDLMDAGLNSRGYRYILVVVDLFTKFAAAYPVKRKKADEVARLFNEKWVLEGGRVPQSIVSDNGTEFVNETMREVARIWQIEHKRTLPYHSRANGVAERFNRTLEEIMRRLVNKPEEWQEALPYAIFAYNNSPHSATGETPNFLMNARDERIPASGLVELNDKYVVDSDEYKTRLASMMYKTREEVRLRLEKERERMKSEYDRKYSNNKGNEPMIGDRVYVRRERQTGSSAKFEIGWEGPFRIIGRSDTTAKVVGISEYNEGLIGEEKVVQLDKLRVVYKESEELDNNKEVIGLGPLFVDEEIGKEEIGRGRP